MVALALAGCSAGQDTQTDSAPPAVNGSLGQVGPIAIRDAMFAYAGPGGYKSGGSAPLVLVIVNTGTQPDELVAVGNPTAESFEPSGPLTIEPRRALAVGRPGEPADVSPTSSVVTTTRTPSTSVTPTSGASGTSSSSSSSSSSAPPTTSSLAPGEIPQVMIVLTGLATDLKPGKTYPVTFVFRNAGTITLDLPIAVPNTPRLEPTGTTSHG